MSYYKVISESDDIKLLKKDNKFKLELDTQVSESCNLIKLINKNLFFDLLSKISPKILKEYRIEPHEEEGKSNIFLILNELDEDEDEKLYITFTQKIKQIGKSDVVIVGKNNNIILEGEDNKKVEIDDLVVNVKLIDNRLCIKLKVCYTGKKLPVFSDNIIGHVFKKMFNNLILYCKNN